MLFVLAQGRSGTAFLSELLAGAPRTLIRHEAPGDAQILSLSRYGRSERAVDALLSKRFESLLPRDPRIEVYGEVNSFLRYNADWLRRRFDPVLLHVVRDGRAFVRSAWEREVLTSHQRQLPIVPTDDDPFAEAWPGMSRFERICWIWQHTNEMLGASVERHARLEDLLASHAAFRAALLEPLGLEIPEEVWRAAVKRPKNTSSGFRWRRWAASALGRPGPGERLPHWTRWPAEQEERFWRICGKTMERFGYLRESSPGSRPTG
jgi:hypothetical protein